MKSRIFIQCIALFFLAGCTANQAKIDGSLKKYFDAKNVDGCFAFLDNSNGKITVYNFAMDTARFLPASTFKMVNGLIALETGVATSENMIIKWNGHKANYPNGKEATDWNKDLTFKEAFKVSAVPYFQELARQIGKDTMQLWLDSLGYGTKKIKGPLDSFWLNNSLKISPDEQLGFIKKLYFEQLPFRKSVQQTITGLMLQEDNTTYKLSYKTGWGFDEKNNSIGWLTGWIEENRHVYFFVTLLKSPDKNYDMSLARLSVTKDILKSYGFFEGKK